MDIVDISDAKQQLSMLIRRALDGEQIVIGQAGHPLAELRPFRAKRKRVGGIWQGKVRMSDDFDEPQEGFGS